jgi:hypothetical protein
MPPYEDPALKQSLMVSAAANQLGAWDTAHKHSVFGFALVQLDYMCQLEGIRDGRRRRSDRFPMGLKAMYDQHQGALVISREFLEDPATTWADVNAVLRVGSLLHRQRSEAIHDPRSAADPRDAPWAMPARSRNGCRPSSHLTVPCTGRVAFATRQRSIPRR